MKTVFLVQKYGIYGYTIFCVCKTREIAEKIVKTAKEKEAIKSSLTNAWSFNVIEMEVLE